MKTLYNIYAVLVIAFLFAAPLAAQDIHWSQFGQAPLQLSPALAGVFKGDMRVGANLRTQWNSVPVGYETYSVWGDASITSRKLEKSRFGLGFLATRDQAGFSDLRNISIGINGSYTHALTPEYALRQHQLTIGISSTYFNRQFQRDRLEFDEQYITTGTEPSQFDPSAPNGEDLSDTRKDEVFDLGVGLNYRYQLRRKRTALNLGAGLHHITTPDVSFFDQSGIMLPMRLSVYGLTVWHIADDFDLLADVSWQLQGAYDEVVLRPALRIHLNQKHTREASLDIGVRYRLYDNSDAIAPDIQLNFRQFRLGLTYDLTLSDFTVANSGRGGPEMSFSYIFTKVRPIPVKICPVY